MTMIVRELDKLGSKMHKKEVLEAVSIIETPPLVVVGVVGYMETPRGLRQCGTVWAQHISENVKRRLVKNWWKSKKTAFKHTQNIWVHDKKANPKKLGKIMKYSSVVRVIAHTQVTKIPGLRTKRAHIIEIQVNGGTIRQKVDFARKLFEKQIPVSGVFTQNETIDLISVTKGKGFNGVVRRFGVRKLPRKTHKGLRKVACIGAWHPSRVSWAVPRAGQMGFHHRTHINNKIYRIGQSIKGEGGKEVHTNAMTEFDLTEKSITPMGGYLRYGIVREDYVMIKGSIAGAARRPIILRKSIIPASNRNALESIALKFIDTASQQGAGRFQTADEKAKFFGPLRPRPGPPPGTLAYQYAQKAAAAPVVASAQK